MSKLVQPGEQGCGFRLMVVACTATFHLSVHVISSTKAVDTEHIFQRWWAGWIGSTDGWIELKWDGGFWASCARGATNDLLVAWNSVWQHLGWTAKFNKTSQHNAESAEMTVQSFETNRKGRFKKKKKAQTLKEDDLAPNRTGSVSHRWKV
ncbi:hypothetical protein B0H14DRAFT_2558973 [Mycena olivaceomarginata]|nr:hypothetical protein B0H14DRAFT_2558973 [Mycena olivaceomarginata]